MNNLPILMTASVSTRGMAGADFSDEEREKMYINSLNWYIARFDSRKEKVQIVFVENSGWDLTNIKAKMKRSRYVTVELVSLSVDLFDISRGKGYNEFLLITKGIEASSVISRAFLKVTGRYPILNIEFFLKEASNKIGNGFVFYGDIKDHCLYQKLGLKWTGHIATSVLFASTVGNWRQNIEPQIERLNDYAGYWAENLLYDYMQPFRGTRECRVSCRFGRELHCGGVNGFKGSGWAKDNNSFLNRVNRLVGNLIRIFLPFFWF